MYGKYIKFAVIIMAISCAAVINQGCFSKEKRAQRDARAAQMIQLVQAVKAGQDAESVKLLEALGPDAKEVVPEISEILKNKDPYVRALAAKTLIRIGPDAEKAIPELKKALEKEPPFSTEQKKEDFEAVLWIAIAVVKLEGPLVVPEIAKILMKTVPKYAQDEAVEEVFVDILGKVARGDEDPFKLEIKAKSSEAKTNLSSIFVAQIAYFAENGKYGKTFEEIGWMPEGNNKYHYGMGEAHIKTKYGTDSGEKCGNGDFPDPSEVSEFKFIIHASANIDNDPYIDGWQIDDRKELIHVCDDSENE